MGSGIAAARTVLNPGADLDANYRRELGWVLADHKKLRDIPDFMLSERMQRQLPAFMCDVAERMFRVDNPEPKPGIRRIVRSEMKCHGVRARDLARDGWTLLKGFG